jgi:GNAT superfamily N-acetyltransferase
VGVKSDGLNRRIGGEQAVTSSHGGVSYDTIADAMAMGHGMEGAKAFLGRVGVELSSRVERATSADLAQLAALRVEQGWYGSEALLWAVQTWEQGRHFIVRASALDEEAALEPKTIVAVTSAIAAGPVAVIGNVVTRAGLRGRGLGSAVMSATLDWLRAQDARSVLLDATSDGQPLYQKLGFVARERSWYGFAPLAALHAETVRARAGLARVRLRSIDDLPAIAALDRAAFGGDRLELLRLIASASDCWLYTAGSDEAPDGYLLVRALEPPRVGIRLGPWVAKTAEAGAALLEVALDANARWRETVTISDELHVHFSTAASSAQALELFRAAGGTLEVDDVVMQLDITGDPPGAANPTSASLRPVAERPEWLYSWLAPLVF